MNDGGHTVDSISNNLSKHCMFVRQFIRLVEGKEELGGIGVSLSRVCHSDQTSTV
jgi:hypothetical protein